MRMMMVKMMQMMMVMMTYSDSLQLMALAREDGGRVEIDDDGDDDILWFIAVGWQWRESGDR